MSVLHENSERGFADKAEAETFENLSVLGFRKYLHRVMTALGSLADEMRDESVGKMCIAQLFADGNALDDVAL